MSKYDSDEFSDFFSNNSRESNPGKPNHNTPARNSSPHRNHVDFDYSDDDIYDNDNYDEYGNPISNDRAASKKNTTAKEMSRQERMLRNKIRKSERLGIIITTIQLIISAAFIFFLYYNELAGLLYGMLPFSKSIPSTDILGMPLGLLLFYICLGLILLILYLITFSMQKKSLKIKAFGKFLSILISILLVTVMIGYSFFYTQLSSLGGTKKVSANKPFVVYLSGNDTEGEMSTTGNGRSDTNILAVVNPKTSTILLLTTPRDSYLEITGDDIPEGVFDKLTHAGLYGTGKKDSDGHYGHGPGTSINVLSKLYNINIDNYVKINFTGFINLVDAIGGVTVDIPESFSRDEFGRTFNFTQGPMQLDGWYALTFVRERKSFAGGDFQRGKNQTLFIKTMIKQMISANTFLNWKEIMGSLESTFETDLDIGSLVKLQSALSAEGRGDWNIVSYAASGSTGSAYCYWPEQSLSCVFLDDASVEVGQKLAALVLDGKQIDDTTAEALANGTYTEDSTLENNQ